jgi:hypothetical protein
LPIAKSVVKIAPVRKTLVFTPRERSAGRSGWRRQCTAAAQIAESDAAPAHCGEQAGEMPGSELGYQGTIDDIAIRASIIFVNRYAQVTNGVGWSPSEPHRLAQRLTYEML